MNMAKKKRVGGTASSNNVGERQPVEYELANNFRNLDYFINEFATNREKCESSSEQTARAMVDGMVDASRLHEECEALALSVKDRDMRKKALTILRLASESLELEGFVFMQFQTGNQEYGKFEGLALSTMKKCRQLIGRDFVRIAAELEAHHLADSEGAGAGETPEFKPTSKTVKKAIEYFQTHSSDPVDYDALQTFLNCKVTYARKIVSTLRKRKIITMEKQ